MFQQHNNTKYDNWSSSGNVSGSNIMKNLSKQQQDVIARFEGNVSIGLTTDEATKRREISGTFNVIKPPIDCPAWVCCLLPCIKNIPSMKSFAMIKPDDAEILRNNKWVRYDSTSLVTGDIIRLDEGDIIPADCIILENSSSTEEFLIDSKAVVGNDKLQSYPGSNNVSSLTLPLVQLYMGSHVVQGGATAIVTAIGQDTLLSNLIKEKKFPPKGNVLLDDDGGDGDGYGEQAEDGISLMSRQVT